MADPLFWLLFAACCAVCGMIGWGLRGLVYERAEFRQQELRDREWDERHGIRHG